MESISLPLASAIIQVLGLPGLIFIIWHFDNKKLEKQREMYVEEHEKQREMYEKQAHLQREDFSKDIRAVLS